ncbi:hypothetical protein CLOM_g9252 [Closterium sp. NIES-68]|nr:hypothetical protein CLOM_g9252 [Closterium sp. NIES-68]GJP60233.1 hypothetical protein CLOP_g17444 [Closterium sp. NIES-67]
MAKFANGLFPLLVLLALVCLSPLPIASAGAPRRVARSRQAHEEFRRQRRLTDIVDRGSRPPLHMFETKAHYEEEKREKGESGQGGATSAAPMQYWGGPVMTGNPSVNVYIIYYGNWPAGSGQNVIENFIRSLSRDSNRQGDPSERKVKYWWAINEPYFQKLDGGKKNVSRKVRLSGTVYDKYSVGKSFGENTVWKVVSSKVGDGKAFSYDPHGIYLLLTSKDVMIPGYCTEYCGYHTMDYIGSNGVVYSLVGHHGQCADGCGAQSTSPNGNPAIDATVSTIAHEVAEAATDPDASAGWFDKAGEENADKCSYEVGATKTGRDNRGNEYLYNLVGMKGMRFLIQQNWDRLKNKCVTQRR